MKKLLLVIAFFAIASSVDAQVFKSKMSVGVKSYTILINGYDLEIKDFKGVWDAINFESLDTSLKTEKRTVVFDRSRKVWRLPISYNEAMGIADKDGEEPLQTLQVELGQIKPLVRQKID